MIDSQWYVAENLRRSQSRAYVHMLEKSERDKYRKKLITGKSYYIIWIV
jgi:hypothetical protein